jgi:hypothetical protein
MFAGLRREEHVSPEELKSRIFTAAGKAPH